MHSNEFNSLSALTELYNYAFKYSDQLVLALEEDEFSTKNRLSYKLEQVHSIMSTDPDWHDAPPPDSILPSAPPATNSLVGGGHGAPYTPPPVPFPNNGVYQVNGGSPNRHYPPPAYGGAPPPSNSSAGHYNGQLETVFTFQGAQDESDLSGGGQDRGDDGDQSLYGLYGVPQGGGGGGGGPPQNRISPGGYGQNQYQNRGVAPQVYEFEYEEPRFTWERNSLCE